MIWANETDREVGDLTILNANGRHFALIEATEDGFVELKKGNYKEVSALYERMHRETDNSFYAYTEEIRNESNRNLRDMQYAGDGGNVVGDGKQTGSERFQTDTSGNNEHLRNSDKGELEEKELNNIQRSERDYPIDTEIEQKVNRALSNPKSQMHIVSDITSLMNKRINSLVNSTNNDLYRGKYTGGKHRFSDYAVRHIISEHGDFLREALRAQLPMTPTDIARHLSAVKDNKTPNTIKPSSTKRGNPSIITAYEVNGYTLYAEEITKSSGRNTPSDLIGHTMYKAPTLSTAAVLTTSARTLPKRQSMVLCEYYTTNNGYLSRGDFLTDINGEPAKLNFVIKLLFMVMSCT